MEKMGWSKGKGLGAHEQGEVDHISVKFKDKEDVKGVGFEGHDGTWIAHQVGKIRMKDPSGMIFNANIFQSG